MDERLSDFVALSGLSFSSAGGTIEPIIQAELFYHKGCPFFLISQWCILHIFQAWVITAGCGTTLRIEGKRNIKREQGYFHHWGWKSFFLLRGQSFLFPSEIYFACISYDSCCCLSKGYFICAGRAHNGMMNRLYWHGFGMGVMYKAHPIMHAVYMTHLMEGREILQMLALIPQILTWPSSLLP